MTQGPQAQAVLLPLTRSALVLVLVLREGPAAAAKVRALCGDTLAGLVRAVGFRAAEDELTCVLGFSDAAWRRLFRYPAPKALHPFAPIKGARHDAPATEGDLVLHVRADRPDLCFALAHHVLDALGDAVQPVMEVPGFRYFDNRDLLGFVDGTENPRGPARATVLVGDDDPPHRDGSYLVVQKYLHDLTAWNRMPVREQENVIGRDKLTNVELSDDAVPTCAHKRLTSITDADGNDLKILRDNMPFGSPSQGEFGTLFLGYARDPAITERMLRNMFIGDPPGNYDRILDVSTATTGGLFYVPSASLLDTLNADPGPA